MRSPANPRLPFALLSAILIILPALLMQTHTLQAERTGAAKDIHPLKAENNRIEHPPCLKKSGVRKGSRNVMLPYSM